MTLNKEQILTQLLTDNYAEAEFSVMDNQKKIKFRTLSAGAQMDTENAVAQLPTNSSRIAVLHLYSLHLLSHTLVQYGTKIFDIKKSEETLEFLKELPTPIIDILNKLREDFQKEVLRLSTPKELEAHFFPVSSSEEEHNLSTKGTIQTTG